MNRPVYQDKAWLQRKYDELRSIYAMAEVAGCHARTIHYSNERNDRGKEERRVYKEIC